MARPPRGGNHRPVPDRVFDDPRLAAVYDPLDPDRSDLGPYLDIARALDARTVIDVGCGTGTLACLLAAEGREVIGVDPAAAMLAVARTKAGAERVRFIRGTAGDIPAVDADLVTMTGNVAQVFLDDDEWQAALVAMRRALRGDGRGHLVFETRRPERQAWLEWNPTDSHSVVDVPGAGPIESWYEVTNVDLPFVTFVGTLVFHADGTTLTSTSTLRFRTRKEIEESLDDAGFDVLDVRDAPDRPGKEHVFIARRR